jgi:N-acetylmuramoyl-L-alanine amidase
MSQLSPWQVVFLAVLSLLGLGALASAIQPTAPAAAIKPASIHSEKLISEPAGAVAALPVAAPTATSRPARAFRVGLQIGHYKNHELPDALDDLRGSTGTAGGGRREVDLNYDVANRVAKLLQAQGVIVDLLPATVPSGYNADAFIAIHADGSGSSGPRGYKISTRWSSTVAVQDGMLVDAITDAYRAATGLPEDSNVTRNMRGYYAYANRRPNWRTSYYTPGAIVEMGFMTNAADRAVMFNRTDDVAKGITNGIMDYLKKAYGARPLVGAYAYGHGIVDDKLIPDNAPTPTRVPGSGQGGGGRPGGSSTPQAGNWQVVFMGRAQSTLYTERGSGAAVGTASRGQVLKATIRHGDYYFVTLANGKQGWVHRNAIVVQM